MRGMRRTCGVLGLVAVLCGCHSATAPSPVGAPAASTVAPEPVHQGAAVTETEALEIAARFVDVLQRGDREGLIAVFPVGELVERVLREKKLSAVVVQRESQKFAEVYPQKLLSAFQNGGQAVVIGSPKADATDAEGTRRATLRAKAASGNVLFLELHLARKASGTVYVSDMYSLVTGERVSDTCGRLAPSRLTKPADKSEKPQRDPAVAQVAKFQSLIQAGEHREAVALFETLPEPYKSELWYQLLAVRAAHKCDEALYQAQMESLLTRHARHPACDLAALEYFLSKKRYQDLFDGAERLQQRLGSDPYLESLCAVALAHLERLPEAITRCDKAVAREPGLEAARRRRVEISLLSGKPGETLDCLKQAMTALPSASLFEEVRQAEPYAKFRETPEFPQLEAWVAERAKRPMP